MGEVHILKKGRQQAPDVVERADGYVPMLPHGRVSQHSSDLMAWAGGFMQQRASVSPRPRR
jgi:hypothetical protein